MPAPETDTEEKIQALLSTSVPSPAVSAA